jgi:hypothetical protein
LELALELKSEPESLSVVVVGVVDNHTANTDPRLLRLHRYNLLRCIHCNRNEQEDRRYRHYNLRRDGKKENLRHKVDLGSDIHNHRYT